MMAIDSSEFYPQYANAGYAKCLICKQILYDLGGIQVPQPISQAPDNTDISIWNLPDISARYKGLVDCKTGVILEFADEYRASLGGVF